MKHLFYKVAYLCTTATLLYSCSGGNDLTYQTGPFVLSLDDKGNVTEMTDINTGTNHLALEETSPLLAIRVNNQFEKPSKLTWDETKENLSLIFPQNDVEVKLKAVQNPKYVTFEVTEVTNNNNVDLVTWGPYANDISKQVGECVGVVRGDDFALGIQALNPKTIGGYPTNEDDTDPSFDIFATTSLVDVADSMKVLYRGQTAMHQPWGSVIQAYCRNRFEDRIIPMWNHDKFVAPAYNDGGVIGSKIALFGCVPDSVLNYISDIELGEGLPHPIIEGEWGKTSPAAAQAYIIYDFDEKTLDDAIAFTKKTGLKYLYHGGPFKTWGKFELNPEQFPNGYASLKNCVDRANKEGIKLGLHTLSNFTTTNDPYVTPVPDKRLAKVGSGLITANIDASAKEIPVSSPDYFNEMRNNTLHGVMLGDELIRYEKVSDKAPWTLLNCQRGAWGTKASAHNQGDTISKLLDHGYAVFLTDTELTKEQGRNLADLFNETGIMQISFDGLEGAWSTGLGQYGLSLMIKEWYDNLETPYKNCINDASMTTHYNWHTFTRMNWGEPWYAGFRESQLNYRLMNQDFYRRNLIPNMLGWFKYGPQTGIEDVEWLLARSAAFDAGYTLVTNKAAVEQNGLSEQNITAIREWEKARLSGAFPKELKIEMEHLANEYHLEPVSETLWDLYPYDVQRFKHTNVVRQPGEPVQSKWEYNNTNDRQPIQFLLTADENIKNPVLSINNYSTVPIGTHLKKNETAKYVGGNKIVIYDSNWKELRSIPIEESAMMVDNGNVNLVFTCQFESEDNTKQASAEFKTVGSKKVLTSQTR